MKYSNRTMPGITRGVCAALLVGATFGAAAQATAPASSDANVDPVAARQQAQEIAKGDPARWYRDDPDAQTRRKEIGAALQEARNACRQQPAAERKACTAEAQATYTRELAALGGTGRR